MIDNLIEVWKVVNYDFDYIKNKTIEVSNLGNIRSSHKISKEIILKCSETNGYKVLKQKFFKPRTAFQSLYLENFKKVINNLSLQLKALKLEENVQKNKIIEINEQIVQLKLKLKNEYKKDVKSRTIYTHELVHRIVAQYFLPLPKKDQIIVSHLDYNKHNNQASNLKWMTVEENSVHQQKSPLVIQSKVNRKLNNAYATNATLTIPKVMLLKKLMAEGKSMKQLTRLFKISSTQINRIKKGENWFQIKAAQ